MLSLIHTKRYFYIAIASQLFLLGIFQVKPLHAAGIIGLFSLLVFTFAFTEQSIYMLPSILAIPLIIVPKTYLHLAEFYLFFLMVSVLVNNLMQSKNTSFRMPLKGTITFLFLAAILSFQNSLYLKNSFLILLKMIVAFWFVYPLFCNFLNQKSKLINVFYGIIVAGFLAAFYGIVENYLRTGVFLPVPGQRIFGRAGGFYGSFLGLATVGIVALLFFSSLTWIRKLFLLAAIIPLGLALAMSQTRAWVVATAVGLLTILSIKIYQSRFRMVVGVVAISLVLLVMMNLVNSPFQFQLAKKLFTRQKGVVSELAISRIPDFSMEFRLRSWQYAWSLFLEHPLCGIGLANLRIAQPWHPQLSKPETGVAYVDNQYLHILTETGLIGTLAWLLLIVPISVTALRNLIRSSDKQWLILNSFLLGALTLYAIGGLFWVLTAGLITQSMLAIIFSLIMSSKQLAVNAHD